MVTEGAGQAVVTPARQARGKRATRIGIVTSASRDKTIKVTFQFRVKQPKYGKYVRRRTVLHAHDAQNEAHHGDLVEVVECRPISKTKHWRLVRILAKAPSTPAGATK